MGSIMNMFWSRITFGILVAGGLALLCPSAVEACTRCFGMGVDGAVTRGISMAMFGLLVMLGVVWGGIGMFFYNMKKRISRREPGDWNVNEQGYIERSDQ
jgi:hypothetical protein